MSPRPMPTCNGRRFRPEGLPMQIKAGFSLTYDCPQPTPMLLCLNIPPPRRPDLRTPKILRFSPPLESWDFVDVFGIFCTRIPAPAGRTTIATEFDIYD